jgi:hypothetical protein
VAKQAIEEGRRSDNHRMGCINMRMLMLGIAGLALAAPPALAQPPGPPPTSAVSQQTEPGRYWVFFDFNRSVLRPDAREVVAEAAESFKRTGATHISLVGNADRTGSPAYNERLSRRRADAVRTELERLGVPASVITVSAEGENAPIVPTPQGVREARNRYVAIDFPERAAVPPVPPPVAAAPPVAPPPPPPPKWAVSLGPWYGHNLKETNSGGQSKTSDLVGPELRVDYALTSNWSLYGDLVGFNTIGTSSDDGWGGRAALGVSHQWNLGAWHPFIGPKVGYISGKGVQDGGIVGPEIGVRFDVARDVFLYAQAAYDHDFRNDFNKGIINGGVGAGYRF